jgi:hypothetical protein
MEDQPRQRTERDGSQPGLLYRTRLRWLCCISTAYMSFGPVVQASCMGSGAFYTRREATPKSGIGVLKSVDSHVYASRTNSTILLQISPAFLEHSLRGRPTYCWSTDCAIDCLTSRDEKKQVSLV